MWTYVLPLPHDVQPVWVWHPVHSDLQPYQVEQGPVKQGHWKSNCISIKFWNKTLQHIKTKCWWVIVTIKVIFALKWHGLVSIWKQSVLWSRNGGLLTFLEVFWKKFEKKNRQRMHTPPYLWPQNLLVSQN